MTTRKTTAARKFFDAVLVSWDSREPWENTAVNGALFDEDGDALRSFCETTGEDFDAAEADVMALIRDHLAATDR